MKKEKWKCLICLCVAALLVFRAGKLLADYKKNTEERLQSASAAPAGQELKKVALTFDDGPDGEYTPLLLDGLKERGIHATFFVVGEEAKAHPELMKRLVQEGHLIGNHTYHHVNLKELSESAAREEIVKTNRVIERYTKVATSFLRPPFGERNEKLEKELEMLPVLWTVDTMDWSSQDEGKICDAVFSEVRDGSIILMHDKYAASVRAAFTVIDCMRKKGYEFVTVDEILMD